MSNYIYCTSDFNNANNFRINLPETIKLNDNWSIALKEISYTSAIYSLLQSSFLVDSYISFSEKPWSSELDEFMDTPIIGDKVSTIKFLADTIILDEYKNEILHNKGNYLQKKLGEPMICVIQKTIVVENKYFDSVDDMCAYLSRVVKISFVNKEGGYIEIDVGENKKITMDMDTAQTLGFQETKFTQRTRAKRLAQLQRNIKNIYIYCDLNEFCYINSIKAPLLKIIPFEVSKSLDRKTFVVNDPLYMKLRKNEFNTILFELRTNTGKLFPFLPNPQTIITLHLKQV